MKTTVAQPTLLESEQSEHKWLAFSTPEIGDEEIAEVVEALRSGWITTGPRTAQFEREFCQYVGSSHALAVNSCTAGLHLALVALGIGPGDEVITTPLTFCATVNVILQTGATPVLADVGPDLNLDPAAIKRGLTPRTRAILPVHMAGAACDMGAIWSLAQAHGLKVIEDAAHAAGTTYNGNRIGSGPSDAVAYSFYATKNLTTGEGGMVTTPSPQLQEQMRILCLHGISRDAWDRYQEKGSWQYAVVELGYKYNMSDIQAAIGIHQLRTLDQMNARRAAIAARYSAAFADLDEVETPLAQDGHAWHLYILRLLLERLTIDRSSFIEEMRAREIGCGVHFIPIPLHPYYQRTLKLRDPCTRALTEYPRLVTLPLYSCMNDADIERVIKAVTSVVRQYRRKRPVVSACGT
jgi:dTDP-4-amino-4,6-dideoxygalactose transaminase